MRSQLKVLYIHHPVPGWVIIKITEITWFAKYLINGYNSISLKLSRELIILPHTYVTVCYGSDIMGKKDRENFIQWH